MIRPPPSSPLSPYATLFRSVAGHVGEAQVRVGELQADAVALEVAHDLAAAVCLAEERVRAVDAGVDDRDRDAAAVEVAADRKSTRLNSSHANISYAAFCLKK